MIRRILLSTALVWACCGGVYAQAEAPAVTPKAKAFVRTKSFYLRDGTLVRGKVLAEDRNGISLEVLDGGSLVIALYGTRDIAAGTAQTRMVKEFEYYRELAEYFAGRTWDFKDDPDDFIQAIRFYEKAKASAGEHYGPDSEQVGKIQQQIARLQADRQVWTREVKSRTELRKLEALATLDDRLTELAQQIDQVRQETNKVAQGLADNYRALDGQVADVRRDVAALNREHRDLAKGIEGNSEDLDRLWSRYRRYVPPRVYVRPPPARPRPEPQPEPQPGNQQIEAQPG